VPNNKYLQEDKNNHQIYIKKAEISTKKLQIASSSKLNIANCAVLLEFFSRLF
jgi:hypothetical protein